ncbi:MAG: CoA transferase [Actinomycetota bacterium]|nr:CoA transferase [Actinomycetota bacterium]
MTMGQPGASKPLAGVRVVDMSTSYAGPTGTMYLADMGAEVIKIERPPGGDDCRHWGPPFEDGWSAWYRSANRNKRSLGIDISLPTGRAILDRLLDEADVFIQTLNPAKLGRLGLDPEAVRSDRPRLVYCAISGFGLDGPDRDLPGYDLIAQARSGLMSVTGEKGRSPQRVSTALSDIVAGITAAFAIVSALHGRDSSGHGATIDVSLLDVGMALMAPRIAAYLAGEPEPAPSGATDSVLSIYQTFDAADRPFVLAVGNDGMWKRLCAVAGTPDLADDPRCATNALRRANRDELVHRLQAAFEGRTAAEWVGDLMAAGVPASLVRTLSEVVADPHVTARDAIVEIHGTDGTSFRTTNHPWRLDGQGPAHQAPALLGGDTQDLLEQLGFEQHQIDALVEEGVLCRPNPA